MTILPDKVDNNVETKNEDDIEMVSSDGKGTIVTVGIFDVKYLFFCIFHMFKSK